MRLAKYHKIPKISPFEGLIFEELLFGGAYVRRKISFSKSIGLVCSAKEIYFFCFVLLCIRGQIPSTSPPGGLYSEGRFYGGFFALRIWGAYIWRGLYMDGLIFGILRYLYSYWDELINKLLLPSNAKWPLPAGAHNLVPVDIPYYLNYLNDTHTILSRKQTQKYGKCLLPLKMAKKVTGRVWREKADPGIQETGNNKSWQINNLLGLCSQK